MEPLFKNRIPRSYRKRSGDRDVSARATHLKAEMGKFLMTTIERKQMSTKTIFKRIALVAVGTLGLGMLSVAPSQAGAILANSESTTASATTASIATSETATVTVTSSFISINLGDSMSVVITNQSAPVGGDGTVGFYITDSANAFIRTTTDTAASLLIAARNMDYKTTAGLALGGNVAAYYGAGTDAGDVSQSGKSQYLKGEFRFMNPTVAGTYVFKIYALGARTTGGGSAVTTTGNTSSQMTWTVTVAANSTQTATTAYTVSYINQAGGTVSYQSVAVAVNLEADSALVVSAGTALTPVIVGKIFPIAKNSSDTKTASAGAVNSDSITMVISGPGSLSSHTRSTSTSKQITMKFNDSAIVWSDGTVGTSTITTYVGTSAIASAKIAQAVKTLKFVGAATTLTATTNAITAQGSNLFYNSDSVTAGVAIVSILATDSAGNALTSADLNNTITGTSGFYAISSDTSVIRAVNSATLAHSLCTFVAGSTTGKFICSMNVIDSGTATITVGDSLTVATSTISSAALSFTVAGAAFSGVIEYDKTSYGVNEKAIITTTAKDRAGRTVGATASTGTGVTHAPFGSISQNRTYGSAIIGATTYANGPSFVAGVDTYVVYMPATAGDVVITTTTSGGDAYVSTVSVTDATATAAAVLIQAAKDAADAATDAATEATDAANEATAAALLAAEAADAATVAAEEARDAADAATAAIADLATQVATFMTALKAQITTLANTVAKIAKKIKA